MTLLVADFVFDGLDSNRVLAFLADAMQHVIYSCPFHEMTGRIFGGSRHTRSWGCPEMGKGTHYATKYKVSLDADSSVTCIKCFTPKDTGEDNFNHPTKCENRDQYQDWWRALPYIVWRVRAIRSVVFAKLGLSEDHFQCLADYVLWLPRTGVFTNDRRITNLIAVAFAYFRAREVGLLGPVGLVFDGASFRFFSFAMD